MMARRNYNEARVIPLLAALLVAAASCPARPGAADAASVEVRVEGVEGEARRNVLALLSIAHPETKDITEAEVLESHRRAPNEIELALQPFGFYRPSVWSELDHRGGQWQAKYQIDPGPPVRVDTLTVRLVGEGEKDPAFQVVLDDSPLKEGDVLVHAAYDDLRERLTTVAMKNGYLDARFTVHQLRVDAERNLAAVILEYTTGPRYVFGPVTFRQEAVDPDLVEGYVTFKRGDPVDYAKLLELEQALQNGPYWSRVDVSPRRDLARGSELPIEVTLVPSKPEKYTIGLGYGTDNGPHARGIVEMRRMNRRGHRGTLEGTFSAIERSAGVRYEMPWPYPRTDVFTLSSSYTETHTTISDEITSAGGAVLSRIWAGWQEAFALQIRREKWNVGLDNGLSTLLVPEASWNRLRLDDPIDPGNGRHLRFRASGAHESALSDASYFRLEALGRWIRAFTPQHRLMARTEAGYVWTNQFHQLPPSVRFFAGGAQSVRGYAYNRLGPRDAAGFVSGGPALLASGVEYEFRVQKPWGVAAFYDVGNAMRSFSDPLAQGVGTGVRWVSPIGLVRLDAGWPIGSNSHLMQFHVSIGPNL